MSTTIRFRWTGSRLQQQPRHWPVSSHTSHVECGLPHDIQSVHLNSIGIQQNLRQQGFGRGCLTGGNLSYQSGITGALLMTRHLSGVARNRVFQLGLLYRMYLSSGNGSGSATDTWIVHGIKFCRGLQRSVSSAICSYIQGG
jgi:hypothetical protein